MLNKKVKHNQTAVTVLLLLLQPFYHDCKWTVLDFPTKFLEEVLMQT